MTDSMAQKKKAELRQTAGFLIMFGSYCIAAGLWVKFGPAVGLGATATVSLILAMIILAEAARK